MSRVAGAFHSATGTTKRMAEAMHAGAARVDGAAGRADYSTRPPGVQAPDLRTGESLGARVARLALRLHPND